MACVEQEIFTCVRLACVGVFGEYRTYDYLPGACASYPFVFIGEQFARDKRNKSAYFGVVTQRVHIYHNDYKKRGTTADYMSKIVNILRRTNKTANFSIDVISTNLQFLPDNTTGTPLMHGVLEIKIKYY